MSSLSVSRWAVSASLALVAGAADPTVAVAATEPRPPAYRLEAGSVASSRIIAVGRDLVVEGQAESHAVVIDGSADIRGRVAGDLIVLGGDARLGPSAGIGGDVFVLGGTIETAVGAVILGRSVAYPDVAAAWMTLTEGPTLGLPATSPVVLGAKLAMLVFWAVLILVLFGIGSPQVLSTSASIRQEPFRNFAVGLTGVFAMMLTALFCGALSGVFVGVPLLALVVVAALGLRFWGMVAVFHAFGLWIWGLFREERPLPLGAASLGLVALGVCKLLPWVGVWSWSIASFIGVGAALTTKLGRHEPWIQTGG